MSRAMNNMASRESHLKLSDEEEEEEEAAAACAYALQLSVSHVLSTVLNAAVKLNLFDIIAGGAAGITGAHISPSEIVSRLPPEAAKNPDSASMLDRMLRVLVSHSLLTCTLEVGDETVGRLYGLAPAGKYFVKKHDGGSFASCLPLSQQRATMEVSLHLKDAILEGGNQFKKVHGVSLYQYMDTDPSLKEVFNRAMAAVSFVAMKKILETYKGFQGLTSLVDVGGGTGKSLTMIVSKYPSIIKAINFDLPGVIQAAPFYPGIEHVGGDMFTTIPKGDAIMIKSILHNWRDEECLRILKNCYEALPKNGKVIIIDIVMSETPESSFGAKYAAQLDIIMLLELGGKERTEKEFEGLCKGSGFSDFQVIPCASAFYVIELYK